MRLGITTILIITLFGCKSDDDGIEPVEVNEANVLILNEGNFNFGNASLSMYNETSKEVQDKVFQANNQGRPIGDVVQSVVQMNNELFVLVNNSSKIEVVNMQTMNAVGSIQQLNSPRYMVVANANKAYVSDLYEDKIYVINPSARTIIKTIATKGWIEEMTIVNNKLYATHVDSNQVWIFDVITDSLQAKLNTHEQPQFVESDKDGNVWVSCTGGFSGGISALYQINSRADSVLRTFEPTISGFSFGEIEMNGAKDEINFLGNGGLYRMYISNQNLPTSPIIAESNRLFYGFSIHPRTNEVYICDALDYQQKGVVLRYDYAGNQIDAFKVGIIPGDVYFLD